jgi:hypothetical protein
MAYQKNFNPLNKNVGLIQVRCFMNLVNSLLLS